MSRPHAARSPLPGSVGRFTPCLAVGCAQRLETLVKAGAWRPNFDLDVVGISENDQCTAALLLYPGVHDAKAIQMLGPLFECPTVFDSEREVVETNGVFVEAVACMDLMCHQGDDQAAWVGHVPRCPLVLLGQGNLHETHDLPPPAHPSFAVGNGQINMPESLDSRSVHRPIIVDPSVPVPALGGRVSEQVQAHLGGFLIGGRGGARPRATSRLDRLRRFTSWQPSWRSPTRSSPGRT